MRRLAARLSLALFSAAFLVFAVTAKELPDTIDLTAELAVSAEGKIVRLEFLRELSPELEGFLRERVQTWSIKPARRDGRAVAGETTLYLRLSLEPDGGEVLVRVAKASTGPRYESMVPPIYPQAALRGRSQAIVMATVELRADGTPGEIQPRMVAGKRAEKAFVESTRRAIARWRFVPERVDGVPVPTQVQVPVHYRIGGKEPLEMPALQPGVPPPEPNELVAESQFRIETDVVGRTL